MNRMQDLSKTKSQHETDINLHRFMAYLLSPRVTQVRDTMFILSTALEDDNSSVSAIQVPKPSPSWEIACPSGYFVQIPLVGRERTHHCGVFTRCPSASPPTNPNLEQQLAANPSARACIRCGTVDSTGEQGVRSHFLDCVRKYGNPAGNCYDDHPSFGTLSSGCSCPFPSFLVGSKWCLVEMAFPQYF